MAKRFVGICHPGVELHELPELLGTGVFRGRGELKAWAQDAVRVWDHWEWVPEEFVVDSDGLVMLRTRLIAKGGEGGVPVEQVLCHVIEFEGDSPRVMRGYLDEASALQAAGR